MLFADILTVIHKLQLSHIKLFHSTDAEITRMQLAKVVITSALVLAACAEGLPEGKDCMCVEMYSRQNFFQTADLRCYTEVDCSMKFNVLTVCTGNQ